MKRTLLVVAVAALYVLHQDIWFWRSSYLVFGFIPIGLFYHACFSVAAALLMWLLVTFAWPSHLEHEVEQAEREEDQAS
jgi:zinc transporter ZupT